MLKKNLLLVAGFLLSTGVYAQVTLPRIGQVHIKELKFTGDGCPDGSARALVTNQYPGSKKADYFQVVFDKFEAKSGKGVKIGDRSNRCNLTMLVTYPKGYRYKFEHSSFSGYATLENGLKAEFESLYSRPGKEPIRTINSIRGPFDGDFDYDETAEGTNGFYTSCEGQSIMSIQAFIRIRGKRKLEGYITRDIQSGSLKQNFGMKWEKCD